MIINLIKPCMGKLILNHLVGNNRQEFRNGLFDSYFFKLTSEVEIGKDCLELCFWVVAFNTILTHVTYYKNTIRFKTRALSKVCCIWRFHLNLGFVCSSLTVTTQKANACTPWTHCVFLNIEFLNLKIIYKNLRHFDIFPSFNTVIWKMFPSMITQYVNYFYQRCIITSEYQAPIASKSLNRERILYP